ncbi:DNA-binding PadR family transcriptional regulator [Nocardia transvalensis]|uniref:DNA-binding PadR family transcriptional regulator n=1 Tax=Nocardia transvalensis TaxID=37333 RepID=A0A7W9PHT9_9NOCA|nr:PadR family transcriptional regulator [Nocardia transvalensis]MBB5915884.1 DNA-binding PadR family transcriptional regulator [Nocardia transvalensis]
MNPRRFAEFGGFGPGPGRFFGPGELRLALLALLDEQPGHGYDLMSRLEDRCGGAYRPSAGAVYPTLQQLEDEGLATVETDSGRKVFHLSAAGRDEIREHEAQLERIWARATRRGEWGMFRDPDAAEILGPALRLFKTAAATIAHAHGDPTVVEQVRDIIVAATREIEDVDADAPRHPRRRRRRPRE